MAEPDVSPPHHALHDINHLKAARVKEEQFSQEERASLDRIVWRKIDRWILPLFTCFFLLAIVDASNIGNARIAGLQKSLAISNYQYSFILTMGGIPFIISEFPSTLLLKYIGPNFMLPTMMALWGVTSASQGLVNNSSGLLACRLLQGAVGGGLFPGIIFYLSFFYPRKWLQIRIAVFYASFPLSGTLSGLLAAAIEQLNGKGGKPGWAWIFILEGMFTFVFGVISFFFLPRSPETAHFLTEKERAYVVSALKQAGSVSEDEEKDNFSWTEVSNAIKSPHVWLFAVLSFFGGAILIGVASFEPTIVATLGYTGSRAQLMSVPPFAIAIAFCLISSLISDHFQCRGYTVIFFSLLKVIGFTMFYVSTSSHVRYASLFFFVTGSYGVVPAKVTWLTNNSAPHTRRATAVAIIFIMTESGSVLGIWLLGFLSPAPNFTTATITFIIMSIGLVVLSTANLAYLWRQNQWKAEKRQRMRKEEEPEGLGDRSAWFVYSL